jgi:formylglycine-generating enzyme required for sulfatase activity
VYTAPVGSYPAGAGPFGTLDQAGNVWEWTASRYEKAPDKRVTRGGGDVATPAAFATNHRARRSPKAATRSTSASAASPTPNADGAKRPGPSTPPGPARSPGGHGHAPGGGGAGRA